MTTYSFVFWLVFPFIFMLYWAIPSSQVKAKKWYLIIASYAIYLTFFALHALVLLYVTAITYKGALYLEKIDKGKKRALTLLLILSFLPLFSFKYLDFFATSTSMLLGWVGISMELRGLNWAIPVGISFYTLQAVAYMVEVYYKKTKAEQSFTDYMLFISFFPHIVCGPISLASELLPQIKSPKPFNYDLATSGMKRIVWGLFLKLAIADRAGLLVDYVYGNFSHFSGSDCFLASVVYSIQIYADFAGYSMMAIGIANLLGYKLVENFRRPYFALTVSDFWRRWHISLSRWLKYNIYIPLGGNRCSRARNYLNLLLTFTVSGLWHGANWTFVFWGITHGISLVVEKFFGIHKFENISMPMRIFRIFITFNIVNLSWYFFRMPTISEAFSLIGHTVSGLFSSLTVLHEPSLLYLLMLLPILVAVDVADEFFDGKIKIAKNRYCKWAFYISLSVIILFVGVLDSGQFIYAKF